QPQAIVQETHYDPADTQRLATLKVLIVDDSATQRELLRHQLSQFGITEMAEGSGADAIATMRAATAANQPFGLVVLDLELGEVDGLWLAQALTSNPAIAPARVLALSSLGRRLNPSRMQALGVAGCVAKPVRQSRLFECLVQVMSANAAALQPGQGESQLFQASRAAAAKNVRVLVAEDNIVNQRLVVRQLRRLGYSAEAVASGQEV